jgi:hypothetical protein
MQRPKMLNNLRTLSGDILLAAFYRKKALDRVFNHQTTRRNAAFIIHFAHTDKLPSSPSVTRTSPPAARPMYEPGYRF